MFGYAQLWTLDARFYPSLSYADRRAFDESYEDVSNMAPSRNEEIFEEKGLDIRRLGEKGAIRYIKEHTRSNYDIYLLKSADAQQQARDDKDWRFISMDSDIYSYCFIL